MKFFLPPKFQLMMALLCGLCACATGVKPVNFSESANSIKEMETFKADLQSAQNLQVDVAAPNAFQMALDSLQIAQIQQSKNMPPSDVLKSIGEGKGYLNQAQSETKVTQSIMFDVMKSRAQALTAGGDRVNPTQMTALDNQMKNLTGLIESGDLNIALKDKENLQDGYDHIELNSIIDSRLGRATDIIKLAKKNGVQKNATRLYLDALKKYRKAESTIKRDRHNDVAIDEATGLVNTAIDRLEKYVKKSHSAKNKPSEDRFLDMDTENHIYDRATSENRNPEEQEHSKSSH